MYNRNGKKIEWWWRELGLPRELVLPESWAFRFIIDFRLRKKLGRSKLKEGCWRELSIRNTLSPQERKTNSDL